MSKKISDYTQKFRVKNESPPEYPPTSKYFFMINNETEDGKDDELPFPIFTQIAFHFLW